MRSTPRWHGCRSRWAALGVACVAAIGAWPARSSAQLVPDRLYYGVNRPIPMSVRRPEGAEGELSIRLLSAPDAEAGASAPVPEGRVDLAGLFPALWTGARPSIMYAQLVVGEEAVGAPVVLQPLLTPDYAHLVNMSTGEPVLPALRRDGINRDSLFSRALTELRMSLGKDPAFPYQPVFSGIRAYVDKHVVFETTEGPITFRLRPDVAPNTVWNFRELVRGGWYTDIAFHRVLPGFVIQCGDPTGAGTGGPGYFIDLEPSTLPHDFGVLSMARSGDPNSNGAQIFVCLSRQRTQGLDGRYTSFGEAVDGAEAIMAVSATPLADPQQGTPVEAPRIESARLVDAPPAGSGPDPAGPPQDEEGGR